MKKENYCDLCSAPATKIELQFHLCNSCEIYGETGNLGISIYKRKVCEIPILLYEGQTVEFCIKNNIKIYPLKKNT